MQVKIPVLAGVIVAFLTGFVIAESVSASKTSSKLVEEIAAAVKEMQQAQAIVNHHPSAAPGVVIEPIPPSVVKEQETLFIVQRRILLDDLGMLNKWATQSKDVRTVVAEVYPWSSAVTEEKIKRAIKDPNAPFGAKGFDGGTPELNRDFSIKAHGN